MTINWEKLAQQRGFNNDKEMFIAFSKQKTLTQIAVEFGVLYSSIYRRLKKLGFKKGDLFSRGGPNNKKKKPKRTDRLCRKCGKPCWPNYFYCKNCLRLIN